MAFDLENRKLNASRGTDLPLLSFVMCGGSGSRLWPLSRMDKPKQFHRLSGGDSLLSATLKRLQSAPDLNSRITVIGAQNHQMQIAKTISARSDSSMILEPVARNTAAVAALATLSALADYDDALILLCPADHDISTTAQFCQSVVQGIPAANSGAIVTFGLLPERPETGYGYIEAGEPECNGYKITRFVEKPDHETALAFIRQGNFFWNAGIFLFRARIMREIFLQFAPDIWHHTERALQHAICSAEAVTLPEDLYQSVPAISFDHAIMEKADRRVLIPASFIWSDLGSWQSLCKLEQQHDNQDDCGNVLIGDVIAHDCSNSYIRSEAGLLTISGLKDMAVIALKDATFIAPLTQSHQVQAIVKELIQRKRAELYYEQPVYVPDIHRQHIKDWLFEKALPYWAIKGTDHRHGGFYESLSLQGLPVAGPRRTRTMARQIYAFAKGQLAGWSGTSADLVSHGLLFMQEKGRNRSGGWAQSFTADGTIVEARENFYDQTCMLLALSYAHQAGHNQALQLGQETFAFLDSKLAHIAGGFYENRNDRDRPQALLTSNAHMHYLEACLAWHEVTGDGVYLSRADEIVELCKDYFFDRDFWCLKEFFHRGWRDMSGVRGEHTEPGHYFEWAALLSDYANRTDCDETRRMAHRLYSCALSTGINRTTGLTYNVVSREGRPVDRGSRSWQQCEAIKAAIMLDGYNEQDLKPEIEARIATLFRWHLHPAPEGLWFDRLDAHGANCSDHVPASILYHLVSALTLYLQHAEKPEVKKWVNKRNVAERIAMPI
ncbi:AGE family epimerase/isomerase [Pseudochrobactrum asaccharolyticum]|uniref:Mannose-1-phosphate guanylyltransferase/mannose-6-phosphate isomerase n=1 Tax=Pseudochrobactrum asaccharolyticum TaxID=354351 RepID=A0A366E5D5_9HYPH|nr:AGE family epimerase/isomerase [Pseudochrobactrum asaccharolyticum]RBO97522.1 mannose-1-phosphate guanylyltransferase/mannose-6-phosphate isomerase [Pseudochrobactrum asaccharolyticum]